MRTNDDGHSPETCNYTACNANTNSPCPFMKDEKPPAVEQDLVWDYETIRRLTPEEHDDLAGDTRIRSRRKPRIGVRSKVRYQLLRAHPFCALCGATVADGIRLEVDHIDGNPVNNHPENLQVLCQDCNVGKGEQPWNIA